MSSQFWLANWAIKRLEKSSLFFVFLALMRPIFVKASKLVDFRNIESLARDIWEAHYTPIIGKAQVDYMLDKYQSVTSMQDQVENGFEYYYFETDAGLIGYLGVKGEKTDLFLSKVYVHEYYQGNGYGRNAMEFVEDLARSKHLAAVLLTVNKHNTGSIKFYERLGYQTIDAVVTDIGNGFVMDDFVMLKRLNRDSS